MTPLRLLVSSALTALGLVGAPPLAVTQVVPPNPFVTPSPRPEARLDRRHWRHHHRLELRGRRLEGRGQRWERHGERLRRHGRVLPGRSWAFRGDRLEHHGTRLERRGARFERGGWRFDRRRSLRHGEGGRHRQLRHHRERVRQADGWI